MRLQGRAIHRIISVERGRLAKKLGRLSGLFVNAVNLSRAEKGSRHGLAHQRQAGQRVLLSASVSQRSAIDRFKLQELLAVLPGFISLPEPRACRIKPEIRLGVIWQQRNRSLKTLFGLRKVARLEVRLS